MRGVGTYGASTPQLPGALRCSMRDGGRRLADGSVLRAPRAVIHIDMDAYFASIEQRDKLIYKNRPLVVCHSDDLSSYRGVVAAASYEAREFGVKAGMSVLEAKLRLPKAVYVNGNYDKYLHNTRILMQICERYSDAVEVYSVDEAFIDMTHTARIFGSAAAAAAALKDEIQRTLRVTCSVGVAPNKLMAKMASEFNKPAGLTVFKPGDLPEVLFPLPVGDIPGVGRRMKKHLDAIGIKTIGHLASTPVELLQDKFGIIGELLHRAANGIDDSPVIATHQGMDVKSFGQSISLGKGSFDVEYLYDILLGLCEGATRRMRKDGYLGKTVTVYLILGRVFGASRQTSLTGHTDLPGKIFTAAKSTLSFLLEQRVSLDIYPVTKIGIGVTNLTQRDVGRQMCVFDLLDEREAVLVLTADALKNKFGDRAITKCSLLGLRGRYMGVPRSELGIF